MKDTWIYAYIYGGREEESLLSTSVRRTFSSNERLQVRAHRMPPGATGCKDGHDRQVARMVTTASVILL